MYYVDMFSSWVTPTLNRASHARPTLIVKGNILDYHLNKPSSGLPPPSRFIESTSTPLPPSPSPKMRSRGHFVRIHPSFSLPFRTPSFLDCQSISCPTSLFSFLLWWINENLDICGDSAVGETNENLHSLFFGEICDSIGKRRYRFRRIDIFMALFN